LEVFGGQASGFGSLLFPVSKDGSRKKKEVFFFVEELIKANITYGFDFWVAFIFAKLSGSQYFGSLQQVQINATKPTSMTSRVLR
jgi:hypothetical protein